jgi:hypothetical protein
MTWRGMIPGPGAPWEHTVRREETRTGTPTEAQEPQ